MKGTYRDKLDEASVARWAITCDKLTRVVAHLHCCETAKRERANESKSNQHRNRQWSREEVGVRTLARLGQSRM